MKTAEQYLAEIPVNAANFDHIKGSGIINGSLRMSIISALHEYGEKCAQQALKDAADRAEVEGTHSQGTIGYCVDRESILNTPIITP